MLNIALPSAMEWTIISSFISLLTFLVPVVTIILFVRVKKMMKEMETLQQKVAKLEQQDLKKSE